MIDFITNFHYKRNILGAIGFYLFYTIFLTLLISMVAVLISELIKIGDVGQLGSIAAFFVLPVLSVAVLRAKGLTKNIPLMILAGVTSFLSYYKGAVVGMIIPTLFTLLNPKI